MSRATIGRTAVRELTHALVVAPALLLLARMLEPDESDRLAASKATATAFKLWGALLAFVIIGALLLPGAGRERHVMENASAAAVVVR